MADRMTRVQRSRTMAAVRSRGNLSTEVALVEILRDARISGWRRHVALVGRPDFVFRRHRVVIFVDGCFWQGCPRCYTRPATRRSYWDAKVMRNRARDARQRRNLRAGGWSVLRIWEHELERPARVLIKLKRAGLAATKRSFA
jgi:DNA mismatch endonuclease (patch repair protein)